MQKEGERESARTRAREKARQPRGQQARIRKWVRERESDRRTNAKIPLKHLREALLDLGLNECIMEIVKGGFWNHRIFRGLSYGSYLF